MHFGQNVVKISQTSKLENLTSFEQIFLNLKNSNLKNFWIMEHEKLKPEPPKRQLNSNLKKSKLVQALLDNIISQDWLFSPLSFPIIQIVYVVQNDVKIFVL